ncbi:MAG: N-acyl-D-amino-acid deacylase [Clostridia bacterium]|jgi:N-acyl-D-amino-acid deacylase|nr:N-acyl-D-amino-acid deacylase [Clostridia bacterium]
MDLAINNALIIDPGNKIHSKLNIGINKGKIVEITQKELSADEVIDGSGMTATPGFIDAHMHEGDYYEASDCFDIGIFESMLKMGVTTAIGGNCGSGPENPIQYLDAADRLGLPINLALLVPHDTLRRKIKAADKYMTVSTSDICTMRDLAENWLNCGCIGISFGIRYIPGIDSRELHNVSEAARKSGKIIAAHIRDDASRVIPSIAEIIEVAAKHEIPAQVSHIGSMGGYGQMDEALAFIDYHRANGLDIYADCYPYAAFSTCIGETTYDDGFLERYNTTFANIEIADGPYKGKRCTAELFKMLRAEAPDTITIGHVMKESEIEKALIHPGVLIGSDGFMHGAEGHPRAAGTFPKVISEYVRKRKLLSLNDAISKMTWQTAERFGINRGKLSVGYAADITIFNDEEIEDRATFANPTLAPKGITYVVLNGSIAVKHGEIINHKLGRSIRK